MTWFRRWKVVVIECIRCGQGVGMLCLNCRREVAAKRGKP